MTEEAKEYTTILACVARADGKLYIPREQIAKLLEEENIKFYQVHAEFDYFTKDEEGNIVTEEVLGEEAPAITRVKTGITRILIGVIAE